MRTSSVKIFQATLVLALAAGSTLACDLKLSQSISGDFSRVDVGKTVAIIQKGVFGEVWHGFVIEGDNVTACDNAGESYSASMNQLPAIIKEVIDQLTDQEIAEFSLYYSETAFGYSKAVPVDVKLFNDGSSYKFTGGSRDSIFSTDASNFNLAHVLYLDDGLVILIDKGCGVNILPIKRVDGKLQEFIEKML